MNNKDGLLEAALSYARLGWSVLPLGPSGSKQPLLEKWKPYQQKGSSEEEIKTWWQQWPDANVAIVTGEVSGIIVLDIDANGGVQTLKDRGFYSPPTAMATTGGGGAHFYFKHPGGICRNFAEKAGETILPKVDFRGDGGYVVAPPSVHTSGSRYEWVRLPEDGIADAPDWLVELVHSRGNGEDHPLTPEDWQAVIEEGRRNIELTRLAGSLLTKMSKPEALTMLLAWNTKHCKPPLSEAEVAKIVESIARAENRKEKPPVATTQRCSQADLLVELASSAELFHDATGEPYSRIPVDDHFEVWPCHGKGFKRWLVGRFYREHKKAPSTDVVHTAQNAIESKAFYDGGQYELHNRVAPGSDGNVYYDLTDKSWRAVRIGPEGWGIVSRPPILFRRYTHQKAQVSPSREGEVSLLLPFLNVAPEDQLLRLVVLIARNIPGIPEPLSIDYGGQGSGKTLLNRLERELIDPSQVEVLTLPRDSNELVQTLSHHWFAPFDNLSSLPDWVSDLLCCAVSGQGFSKRQLYSDDEDVIYRFHRCISLNGINLAVTKADILDRAILFKLPSIEPEDRKSEAEILREFKRVKPRILGGIFDVLSAAIRIEPTIKLSHLPRMADFALWGCAIAEALGHTKEKFLEAYFRNIKGSYSQAIEASPVGMVLLAFLAEKERWEGTPSELLGELVTKAEQLKVSTKSEGWPKNPNWLTRRLNELKTNLRSEGIYLSEKHEKSQRVITIRRKQ